MAIFVGDIFYTKTNIMSLLENIISLAKKVRKRIILPESTEDRTLLAADKLLYEEIAQVILLTKPEIVHKKSKELNLKHIHDAIIIDPDQNPEAEKYIDLLVSIRKHKGMTAEEAKQYVRNPLYLAPLMIKAGQADGEVAGAANATANVLKPAFQIIKTSPGINVVSGAFLMILPDKRFGQDGVLVFADCAVNPDPDESELAQIALSSANTAQGVANLYPRVAMLSFSTKGSANHATVDKVINATKIALEKQPQLKIDGELQADAAIIPDIGNRKAPQSPIAGNANVLIFPDLASGNIAYKLVERMANAQAIGPILQGMAAPVNDLSRGCSSEDIFNLVAITANQAHHLQTAGSKQ